MGVYFSKYIVGISDEEQSCYLPHVIPIDSNSESTTECTALGR